MHKLYVLLFCLVVMLFVYFAGMHAGYERAIRKISTENTEKQTQIIKIQENVNEDVVNRTTGDIRRILRQKYTIAD